MERLPNSDEPPSRGAALTSEPFVPSQNMSHESARITTESARQLGYAMLEAATEVEESKTVVELPKRKEDMSYIDYLLALQAEDDAKMNEMFDNRWTPINKRHKGDEHVVGLYA